MCYNKNTLEYDIYNGTSWASFTGGVITSGQYTPIDLGTLNTSAAVYFQCQYMRCGNTVTVSGKVNVDPVLTATATALTFSLPIPTNIGAAEHLAGTAFCPTVAGQGAAIYGDAPSDAATMQWVSTDITLQPMYFHFTYIVR